MIDISTEELVSLSEVASMFPGRRGRKVAVATCWRWATRGRKGVRLETISIGGRRYTSREALMRWIDRLNPVQRVEEPLEEQAAKAVADALDECGL
jgi:hypothetical protein